MTAKRHDEEGDVASQVLGAGHNTGGTGSSGKQEKAATKKSKKATNTSKKTTSRTASKSGTQRKRTSGKQQQKSKEEQEVEKELSAVGKREYHRREDDTDKSRKDIYYIGIEDPKDLRREVLSSAKSLVLTLRKFEQIRENRKQKVEYFSQLKALIKEINVLVSKLKGYMPETKLRHLPVPKKKEEAEEQPKQEESQPAPQPEPPKKQQKKAPQESELDKLERELRMIEGKLEKIDS